MAKDANGHGSDQLAKQHGAHTVAIHAATAGKTLADVSALGTTQGAPVAQTSKGPPPNTGGFKS